MSWSLPLHLEQRVKATLEEWRARDNVRRLWERDATLWTGRDEAQWLGWLDVARRELGEAERLARLQADARQAGFAHALLLGMGGSSLSSEVVRQTFGRLDGFPDLLVLDSIDPAQVLSFERRVDLARTLVIVASKSGTTLELDLLRQYFFDRVGNAVGRHQAGSRFMAITDPGSPLQQRAERDRFRHVSLGAPDIDGRYSALSDFAMVPSAIMGVDVRLLLRRACAMADRCGADVPPAENPGVMPGIVLGTLGREGRDKVTLVTSPRLGHLGAWVEQLLAESTGKQGRGLVPIDLEQVATPGAYGDDRVFVYTRLDSDPDAAQDAAIDGLERAGQPVLRIDVPDVYDLGAEFFRWEVAAAVAGAVLGVNAFDQPDVEASKIETRRLTASYEQTGTLPHDAPVLIENGLAVFADSTTARALQGAGAASLSQYLAAHLGRLGPGDYLALLAYIEMNDANRGELQRLRHLVRDARRVATCVGFGPRFLHSTGQLFKGGPNTGVFLQITCADVEDVKVPGRPLTLGTVKAAQASGDFAVLAARGRRLLRVHLGSDVVAGLTSLRAAMEKALSPPEPCGPAPAARRVWRPRRSGAGRS